MIWFGTPIDSAAVRKRRLQKNCYIMLFSLRRWRVTKIGEVAAEDHGGAVQSNGGRKVNFRMELNMQN